MNKYECLKLSNQLCFPLYLCSKEIIRKYTVYLDEINLTYTQYIVMMYLWEHNECNVKEIGCNLLLDSSTLTPLLKKLEDKGYINRIRNKIDERNLIISLTSNGINLKDKAIDIPKEVGKCIDLDVEDAKTLYRLLYKILNNIGGDNNDKRSE